MNRLENSKLLVSARRYVVGPKEPQAGDSLGLEQREKSFAEDLRRHDSIVAAREWPNNALSRELLGGQHAPLRADSPARGARPEMTGKKKPGDETLRVPPGLKLKVKDAPKKAGDAFVSGTSSSHPALDAAPKRPTTEVAPEVSQGKWRERVFTPRAVMPREEILKSLEASLRVILSNANHVRVANEELRRVWLPVIRQALEQAGGDGLDVWLTSLFFPPGRTGLDPLLPSLVSDFSLLRAAKDLAQFEEAAHKAIATVQRVLSFERPRKLSFKTLEKELEGKLEVDELFQVAVSEDVELTRRLKELGQTMESLRDQLQKRPGKQPDGMFSNFVRLKAEVRVLDAELRRRGSRA